MKVVVIIMAVVAALLGALRFSSTSNSTITIIFALVATVGTALLLIAVLWPEALGPLPD